MHEYKNTLCSDAFTYGIPLKAMLKKVLNKKGFKLSVGL